MNTEKIPEYTIIHQKRPKTIHKQISAQILIPNTIKIYDMREIEETLSHEIEHLTLYHLCLQHGCNEENAKFGCYFINDPSDGDIEHIKLKLSLLNYHKWNERKLNKIIQPFKLKPYQFIPIDKIPPITHKRKHK